jgi:non-heme chloroperoxidase
MPFVTVGEENSGSVELYYEDHGSGPPVVLIHGYPLSGRAWDKQVPVLLDSGRRVITYDRRGFGKSSRPTTGYDYDTFAADLKALMEKLDLRDATLVGHSMGTGEVTRYLGAYGSDRVARAVLVSPIPPFLLQTDDNPEGLPRDMFDGFGSLVSTEAFQVSFSIATGASAVPAVACIPTWETDFRSDLRKIDVPLLVVQGDSDRILPFPKTGKRLPDVMNDLELVVIEGGPHAIAWTHADRVNSEHDPRAGRSRRPLLRRRRDHERGARQRQRQRARLRGRVHPGRA